MFTDEVTPAMIALALYFSLNIFALPTALAGSEALSWVIKLIGLPLMPPAALTSFTTISTTGASTMVRVAVGPEKSVVKPMLIGSAANAGITEDNRSEVKTVSI